MAFNNWPYTNFQDLNLGWILNKVKEAILKSDNAYNSVGQFDARITANTIAIRELGLNVNNMSVPARIDVNSNREAFNHNEHITGAEIQSMILEEGYFPYVVYNGETYMPDTVSTAGDMRFTVVHTDILDNVVIRRILIPAQSYNAAYSIVNVGSGGGGSSNAVVFEITDSACDHSYNELLSAWNSGKALVANIKSGSKVIATSAMIYKETVTQGGSQIDRFTIVNPELTIGSNTIGIKARYVYSNNTVSYGYIKENIATIDTIVSVVNDGVETNALLKTAQTLSAAEKAQVKQNLGISDSGGSYSPYLIPVTESSGVYSTTATGYDVFDRILDSRIVFNGVYYYPIGSTLSGPSGHAYFACSDPHTSGMYDVDIFDVELDGSNACTVTRYDKDVNLLPAVSSTDSGKFLRVNSSGVWVAEAVPSAESNSFGGA